jgi:hypothetical protein
MQARAYVRASLVPGFHSFSSASSSSIEPGRMTQVHLRSCLYCGPAFEAGMRTRVVLSP